MRIKNKNKEALTAKNMIEQMKAMDNGERLEFLEYLYHEHFCFNKLTDEEINLLRDYHDGIVEVVEIAEY